MLDTRAEVLKESLVDFYRKKKNFEIFSEIICERTSKFSLRIIEWFCNNFSRKYDISYKISKNKEFNVYLSYKSQLDSYSKKQFDPFNRKHKGFDPFTISYSTKKVETTVGQMNFFKWCINNDVLSYIEKNLEVIKKDMILTNTIRNNSKKDTVQENNKSISGETKQQSSKNNTQKQVLNKRKKTPTPKQNVKLRRDTAKLLTF